MKSGRLSAARFCRFPTTTRSRRRCRNSAHDRQLHSCPGRIATRSVAMQNRDRSRFGIRYDPGSAARHHSASKTRVYAPMAPHRAREKRQSMTALWTLSDMAAAMRADLSGAPAQEITGISIDSRGLSKGEAFFALTDVRDGHEFVDAALKAGAGVAVVARGKRAMFAADAPLLLVDDVLEALRDLARAAPPAHRR